MEAIKTESQYNAILARIDELIEIDNLGKNEGIELDVLTDLIVAYEAKHFSVAKPDLIDVLKLRMYEMGINQNEMAQLIGVSSSRVSEYLNKKSEPPLGVAREISRKLNIEASVVLGV